MCSQQRRWFVASLLATGTAVIASPSLATMSPPVIRARHAVQQTPPCYVKTANSQLQSLMHVCLVGKADRRSPLFDLKTDRDGDGVPDELFSFFQRLDAAFMPPDQPPNDAGRLAQATKQRAAMHELAQRLPVAAATSAALKQMGDSFYQTVTQADRLSEQQVAQQNQRLRQITETIESDPVIQKFEAYADRYRVNQLQQIQEQIRQAS